MPWNEPGGQPPKDPWGNRRPQGGQSAPDLEEILGNASRRLKQMFGTGVRRGGGGGSADEAPSGGGGGILLGLVVLAVVWMAFDSVHIVDARERGVVLTFGAYSRTLDPGLNFSFPRPIEQVYKVDVTQVRSADAQVRMLTADENLVEINFAVQYTIADPRAFLFSVAEAEQALIQSSEAAIRQVIGARPLDDILVGSRAEISLQSLEVLERLLTDYNAGLDVSSVNLQDATVPQAVKDAFDDAIKAREDEQRIANEARAYESQVVPVARGKASRILQEAEAFRDSVVAKAEGEADRFKAFAAQYRQAPEVTRKRLYLETMQDVLSRTSKVLIDNKTGNNMLYLPLDRMQPPPGARDAGPQMSAPGGAP